MTGQGKRKMTVVLLATAGAVVVTALWLASTRQAGVARASRPPAAGPLEGHAPAKVPAVPPAPIVAQPEPVVAPRPQQPKVDVVFVLDTTGSMAGLISGAKRKIWSIANQILSGQPKPDVRIGLIGYRDLGDDYVTRRFDLSGDIDDVYANLRSFVAGGGGDTPEHVNLALSEAVHNMQWREGQQALRQIYLVGDAPPHEGRQGYYSHAVAREAQERGIVINAVRCGDQADTARAWQRIALAAGGLYDSLRQDGAMVAISTPMDRKLAELNAKLSATVLPMGSEEAKARTARRLMANSAMDAAAQAESAVFRARSTRLYDEDLIDGMAKGKRLSEVAESELPAAVAAQPKAEREGYVAGVAQKRAALVQQIAELSKQRDSYIKALPKRPGPTSLDDTIGKALKTQGTRAGIAY